MAVFAIGDIQGCFTPLNKLLDKIHFDPTRDTLWSTGDLVNRGPQSLEVLRFLKNLPSTKIVLGNHDLNLLAVAFGTRELHPKDTLQEILQAPDKNELLDWLRMQPLFIVDEALGYCMAHAGIAPMWNIHQARALSREVEVVLKSDNIEKFLAHMYGNKPDRWSDDLIGMERLRCITNYFTRMRFCDADGRLDLHYKGDLEHKPMQLIPWFMLPNRVNKNDKIIFGHWAALGGRATVANVFPLDTGCVWGNCLTAMNLESGERVSVSCA